MTTLARTDLAGLDRNQLAQALAPLGGKGYLPGQIFRWIYGRKVADFAAMTDVKKELRAELAKTFDLGFPEVADEQQAADGTTRYVWRLGDGLRTESVYIPGEVGQATLCLSSQVGCPLACSFCVSGLEGVKRNLTTAEILGQARGMLAGREPLDRTNVVFMGMGEALLNLDEVARSFAILSDPEGFAIALKRMTVSTAGHVPGIEQFGALPRRPRLAVSLNASNDEVRDRIMPINRAWPLARLLAAVSAFPFASGERVTFEYVLLRGINDAEADARRLPALLAHIPCKVNLIPWNQAPGFPYREPEDAVVERFAEILHGRGMTVTVRRRRGADAGAACGQLALSRGSGESGNAVAP